MTDSQRSCFLAVAEHRSFSKAASVLYVSQPAVSKNIRTLEAELGSPLFDRQGKYINLTKAGEIFLNFLLEYRREFDSMLQRVKALDKDIHRGTVRIGCGLSWNAAHFYTRLARHFAIHYPDIQIEVEGLDPEAFTTALRRKDIDLAIMYSYDLEHQSDLTMEPLTTIGSGFLCSSLILQGGGAGLEELMNHPFLFVDNPTDHRNSYNYRRIISELCRKYGFIPRFKSCRNLSSALVDVSCGKGSLMVDDWTAGTSNSEYCYIPSGDRIPICLAYQPTTSDSLLSLFVSETLKVFNGNF